MLRKKNSVRHEAIMIRTIRRHFHPLLFLALRRTGQPFFDDPARDRDDRTRDRDRGRQPMTARISGSAAMTAIAPRPRNPPPPRKGDHPLRGPDGRYTGGFRRLGQLQCLRTTPFEVDNFASTASTSIRADDSVPDPVLGQRMHPVYAVMKPRRSDGTPVPAP